MAGQRAANEPNVGGFPEDGDQLELDIQDDDPVEETPLEPAAKVEVDPKLLETLQQQVADQRKEMDALKRAMPPAVPKTTTAVATADPDWDNLLFNNPKEAMKLHAKMVREEVTKELRADYQRDQGTKAFWDKFYAKNKDLKDDHDLVEVTLNTHLPDLANIPTDDAMEKLSELTRERILRYAGASNRKGKGTKAKVEGAEPPLLTKPKPTGAQITTLSDLIKARSKGRQERPKLQAG